MPPKKKRAVDTTTQGETAKEKGSDVASKSEGSSSSKATSAKPKLKPKPKAPSSVPKWTHKQEELLVHSMLLNGAANRPLIYQTPGLEPWSKNSGDLINKQMKAAVNKICKLLDISVLDVSVRRGGGKGGGGSGNGGGGGGGGGSGSGSGSSGASKGKGKRQRDDHPDDGGGEDAGDDDAEGDSDDEEQDETEQQLTESDEEEEEEEEEAELVEQELTEIDDEEESEEEQDLFESEHQMAKAASKSTTSDEGEEDGDSDGQDGSGGSDDEEDVGNSTTFSGSRDNHASSTTCSTGPKDVPYSPPTASPNPRTGTTTKQSLRKALKTARRRARKLTVEQWNLTARKDAMQVHKGRLNQLRKIKGDRKLLRMLLKAEVEDFEWGWRLRRGSRGASRQEDTHNVQPPFRASAALGGELRTGGATQEDDEVEDSVLSTHVVSQFQHGEGNAPTNDSAAQIPTNQSSPQPSDTPLTQVFTEPSIQHTSTFRPLYAYRASASAVSETSDEEDEICSCTSSICRAEHPHHWPSGAFRLPLTAEHPQVFRLPLTRVVNVRIRLAGLDCGVVQIPWVKRGTCAIVREEVGLKGWAVVA